MGNNRTAENYWNIEIQQFRELLKLKKSIKTIYTFTRSRWIGQEKVILNQEQVDVVLNEEGTQLLLGGKVIPIEKTACNYGKMRYWFGCPICGKRAARLFLHGGSVADWKCRECANLVYRSQQATKGDFWTWYDKAATIAQKLNPDYWEDGFSYLLTSDICWLFPERPKGMHWKTYYRLRDKYCSYVKRGNAINAAQLGMVLKRK